MDHNKLTYLGTDGQWHVEDRNRIPVAGSPCLTRPEAEVLARHSAECEAYTRQSREETRRLLGGDYDPTD